MGESTKVLRVSRFQRQSLWSAIDAAIREAMTDFVAQPGIEGVWFGRRGPASGDERVIVSLWSSAADEAASLTIPEMLRDIGVAVAEPSRVILPVAFDVSADRSSPPAILRLFGGRTRVGHLDPYLAEAQDAALGHREHPDGPHVVVTSVMGQDRFLTASAWRDWASLEAFTGGDRSAPVRTRALSRLVGGAPTHYELVY